jgi:hypothetical protein
VSSDVHFFGFFCLSGHASDRDRDRAATCLLPSGVKLPLDVTSMGLSRYGKKSFNQSKAQARRWTSTFRTSISVF